MNEHIQHEHAGATTIVEEMETNEVPPPQETTEELVIVEGDDNLPQFVEIRPEGISLEGQQVTKIYFVIFHCGYAVFVVSSQFKSYNLFHYFFQIIEMTPEEAAQLFCENLVTNIVTTPETLNNERQEEEQTEMVYITTDSVESDRNNDSNEHELSGQSNIHFLPMLTSEEQAVANTLADLAQ